MLGTAGAGGGRVLGGLAWPWQALSGQGGDLRNHARRFFRSWFGLLSLGWALQLFACRSEPRADAQEPERAGPARVVPKSADRGDTIVVEAQAGEFFQGQVLLRAAAKAGSLTPELKVQRADGEIVVVEASDVYVLAAPDSPGQYAGASAAPNRTSLARGALVVCSPSAGRWVGCRIIDSTQPTLEAEEFTGARFKIATQKILIPSELTRMNLEQRFRAADAARSFQQQAARAGQPKPPSGWAAQHRERVLAKHGADWLSGHVVQFRDDGSYRIRWLANQREAEVPKAEVIPEPPYGSELSRGMFALRKPTALSLPWPRVRVVSVRPELVVEDATGERVTVSVRELVPLGHPISLPSSNTEGIGG